MDECSAVYNGWSTHHVQVWLLPMQFKLVEIIRFN